MQCVSLERPAFNAMQRLSIDLFLNSSKTCKIAIEATELFDLIALTSLSDDVTVMLKGPTLVCMSCCCLLSLRSKGDGKIRKSRNDEMHVSAIVGNFSANFPNPSRHTKSNGR